MNIQILKALYSGTGYGNIICFPFAGGHSSSFRAVSQYFEGSQWGVLAIEPPGHGMDTSDLLEDLESMVSLYEEVILNELSKPFILFGHSLGAMVTYMLTRRLEENGHHPRAVILSGMSPPDTKRKKRSHLSDKDLFEYIKGLGGMASELLEDIAFRDYLVPIIRSDFRAFEQFNITDRTPIQSPSYVFAGIKDISNPPELLLSWDRWLTSFDMVLFDGGHMFMVEYPELVAKKILSIAESTLR